MSRIQSAPCFACLADEQESLPSGTCLITRGVTGKSGPSRLVLEGESLDNLICRWSYPLPILPP